MPGGIVNLLPSLPTGTVWNAYIVSHKNVRSSFSSFSSSSFTADDVNLLEQNCISPPGNTSWYNTVHGYIFGYRNAKFEFLPSLDGIPVHANIKPDDCIESKLNMNITKGLQGHGFTIPTMLALDPDRTFYKKMKDSMPISLCDQPGTLGLGRVLNLGSETLEVHDKIGLFYPNEYDMLSLCRIQGQNNLRQTLRSVVTRKITPALLNHYALSQFDDLRERFVVLNDTPKEFQFLAKLGIMIQKGLPLSQLPNIVEEYAERPLEARRLDDNEPEQPASKERRLADEYISDGRYTELESTLSSINRSFDSNRVNSYSRNVGGNGIITLTGDHNLTPNEHRALSFMTNIAKNPFIQSFDSFFEERKSVNDRHNHIFSRLIEVVNKHCADNVNIIRRLCKTLGHTPHNDDEEKYIQTNVDEIVAILREDQNIRKFEDSVIKKCRWNADFTALPTHISLIIFQTMLLLSGLCDDDVGKIMLIAQGKKHIYSEISKLCALTTQNVYDLCRPISHIGHVAVCEDAMLLNKSTPGSTVQIEFTQGELKINQFPLPSVVYN